MRDGELDRLEAFEKMLSAVRNGYETANEKMISLKSEGKEKNCHVSPVNGR